MTTLIAAGGSGSKILESVLHLCAAGLGPNELRLLVIDPDASNGNFTRTKEMLKSYVDCQKAFGSKLGGAPFFKTRLNLISDDVLKIWNPVGTVSRFAQLLNYDGLNRKQQDTVSLFFTDEELNMPMDVGFRGHPAIGAAAMSLLPLYRNDPVWDGLISGIKSDVNQSGNCIIGIAGSVFGGTGASAIAPLARFLRSIESANTQAVRIAAIGLVPYFQFKASPEDRSSGDPLPEAEWFGAATRSAVDFYRHLRNNDGWKFDAMYWLGDDLPEDVPFAAGGLRQQNPAHFVEFLGATAFLDFAAAAGNVKGCFYAGPQASDEPRHKNENLFTWDDLPLTVLDRQEIRFRLIQFAITAGAHNGFFMPLFNEQPVDARPLCVPWYLDRFASKKVWLTQPGLADDLKIFQDFTERFHLPWWRQLLTMTQDRVRLLNANALAPLTDSKTMFKLSHLTNAQYPQDDSATLDGVDRLFSDTVTVNGLKGGGTGAAGYLHLLSAATENFIKREYGLNKRVA
jgi:hypothetical protein